MSSPEVHDLSLADCRPALKAFAVSMEAKLRDNEWDGGWVYGDHYGCPISLFQSLLRKVSDFGEQVTACHEQADGEPLSPGHDVRVWPLLTCPEAHGEPMERQKWVHLLEEAVDVGNLAMLIAELLGGDQLAQEAVEQGDVAPEVMAEPETETETAQLQPGMIPCNVDWRKAAHEFCQNCKDFLSTLNNPNRQPYENNSEIRRRYPCLNPLPMRSD